MPTTTWGLPLWDDTPNVTPLEEFFNSISNAMDDAASTINSNALNAGFRSFTTKALMDAAPGTNPGDHASVKADSIGANNGDYRWNGTAWVPSRGAFSMYLMTFTDGTIIASGANHNVNITFPAGKFTSPPIILFGATSSRFNYSSSSVSTTGATVSISNWSTGPAAPGAAYALVLQMLPGSALG